jgi:hypothetical protein
MTTSSSGDWLDPRPTPNQSDDPASASRPDGRRLSTVHSRKEQRPAVDLGPYSKIPNKIFGGGIARELGPSAALFFLALCEHANRNGSMSFKASDASLAADTGLSPRTICEARKRLMEWNLIACDRQHGNSYTYRLSRYNFTWKPVKERARVKRKPRAMYASGSKSAATFAE